MMRTSLATPCPTTLAAMVHDEFRNAKPMRRQGLTQKPKRSASVNTFEDATAHPKEEGGDEEDRAGRTNIYDWPARKMRLKPLSEDRMAEQGLLRCDSPTETNQTAWNAGSTGDEKLDIVLPKKSSIKVNNLTKQPRRQTIWIPDDTTVLTIHPGAYTHTLDDETLYMARKSTRELSNQKALQPNYQPKREPRPSLAVPPQRTPLQKLKSAQPNAVLGDIEGSGDGKENRLPFAVSYKDKPKHVIQAAGISSKQSRLQPVVVDPPHAKNAARFWEATTTSRAKEALAIKQPRSKYVQQAPKPKVFKAPVVSRPLAPKTSESTSQSQEKPFRDPLLWHSRYVDSSRHTNPLRESFSLSILAFPILPEDLSRTELYEESWLDYQEASLTQLVNAIFEQSASTIHSEESPSSLRSRFLDLYQQADTVALYKRTLASLQYGALGLPKGAAPPRLCEDVALRRQFLDLFLDTYDLDHLQSAVEAVVGRASQPGLQNTVFNRVTTDDHDKLKQRKAVERFMLAFLVRNNDLAPTSAAEGCKASLQSWQKTVLRSLMLVYVLDHFKTISSSSDCLFQRTSIYKSSDSVVRTLTSLIIPSTGDIGRTLGYLGYRVPHVQYPLQEIVYKVDNLAVDLRDGILLTRLVELLMYTPGFLSTCSHETSTPQLPGGGDPTSVLDAGQRTSDMLSQHLRIPCLGRSQKLYNVQTALSSLSDSDGLVKAASREVTARDIVDGHREKTLSLLWALVSQYGLGMVLDEKELRLETSRIGGLTAVDTSLETDNERMPALLKSWASAVCDSTSVHVTNLTTSFADGRALSAIVEFYSAYIPSSSTTNATDFVSSSRSRDLPDKLKALGCSTAFTRLFATSTTNARIPSRETTISLLAFLASRLLPLARSYKAASTIQRAYRLRLTKRTITQRVTLAKLAKECAIVVNGQKRVVDAAVTLQRVWRGVLNRRIEKLMSEVGAFQAAARGWAIRRGLRGTENAGSDNGRKARCGW